MTTEKEKHLCLAYDYICISQEILHHKMITSYMKWIYYDTLGKVRNKPILSLTFTLYFSQSFSWATVPDPLPYLPNNYVLSSCLSQPTLQKIPDYLLYTMAYISVKVWGVNPLC